VTADDGRLAAILGEPVLSEEVIADQIAETVAESRRYGKGLTDEQAREIVLGPLRRARAASAAKRRATEWAAQVAESLPVSSGRLSDGTGKRVREILEERPDEVPVLMAIEALNDQRDAGKIIMRGTADFAVLARKGS
jgi:hypothetical protein